MNKYKDKPTIDEETLGLNPFVKNLQVVVNSIKSNDKYQAWEKNAGEDAIFELANFEYESVPYTKLFCDSKRRLEMVKLNSRAKDLFLWVLYEADKGKDYLWINKVRYMEECGIGSINTFRNAINELIRYGYIIRAVPTDTYWLNPHYFFNGNRLKKYPENIIKKK